MKRLLCAGFALVLFACGSSEHAGGTTVETTNGIAVRVETQDLGLQSPVGGFAVRAAPASAPRWCVLASGDTLPYTLSGGDVWVRVPAIDAATSLDLSLWPDTLSACPAPDSAAVFGADDGYALLRDLGGARFDGSLQGDTIGSVDSAYQSYTLSAEVLLDSGLLGGEVLTIGNSIGFRMDHLGDRAALYGYSSFAGPSNWSVISGETPIGDSSWVRVDLVVDAAAHRFEVYFDGELHFTSPDTLAPITYDKLGNAIVLGQNALGDAGYFKGRLGMVSVSRVARSPDWIKLSAWQGRTGPGWE